MFTGLISDVGTVMKVDTGRAAKRFTIRSAYEARSIALGASIAHDGVCLTVTDIAKMSEGSEFQVEVSDATLAVTTLSEWTQGRAVNLERSLAFGEELGGHLVTGHVDAVGSVAELSEEGGSWQIRFRMPREIAPFVAKKGSIAVQGVSLTVNAVTADSFAANIIPHTLDMTNLRFLKIADRVNLEIDLIARYVARQREFEETPS